MATNWVKVGTDVGVGAVAGAVSGAAERFDENRGETSFFKKVGNYVDYGVPILAIVGSLVGFLKGDWETRAITLGAAFAGRRVTREYIYKPAAAAAGGGKWKKYDHPPEDERAMPRASVGLEF